MTDLYLWELDFRPILARPLLAPAAPESEVEAEAGTFILAGVLLSLVVIYFASKLGGEICSRINLPPVLGELVGGVAIGVSAFQLLIFPEGGSSATDSLIISFLQTTAGLPPEASESVFAAQSEVISLLSELGVIILLFEIGLESDLKELIRVGPQAAIVAVVGVIAPFVSGTARFGLFVRCSRNSCNFCWCSFNCHQYWDYRQSTRRTRTTRF